MKPIRMQYIRIAALLFFSFATPLFAAPKADLWPVWEAHDPASVQTVDHGAWDSFLSSYLSTGGKNGLNTLAYRKVSAADKAKLDGYVKSLESVKVSALNRKEQMAYWINLYNAGTVRLILEKYPVASIRDIKLGGVFSSGPWDEKLFAINGEKLSLNDIEHRILRPIWKDNRIHYAVNSASVSCPNLLGKAFTAENTERLLDEAARAYVNSSRGVDFTGGKLVLSSIYTWYAEDFGTGQAALVRHLQGYAESGLAAKLAAYTGKIGYAYDWSLNEGTEK